MKLSHDIGTTSIRPIQSRDMEDVFTMVLLILIALEVVLTLVFGYLQDRNILVLNDDDVAVRVLMNSLLWGGGLILGTYLLLKKYDLSWSNLGWTSTPHRYWIVWSVILIPVCVGSYLLESSFWSNLVLRLPWPRPPLLVPAAPVTVPPTIVAWTQVALASIVAATGHSLFLQGMMTHARAVPGRDAALQYANTAVVYLVLFLVGAPVGLPLTTALMVTWGYRHTHALLLPIAVGVTSVLMFYIV